MTCQECELALAGEEQSEGIEAHLAECADCREFAVVLRENIEVLAGFQAELVPSLARRHVRRHARRWPWAAAAAAGVAIAAMLTLAVVLPKKQAPPVERAVPVTAVNVTPRVPTISKVQPVKRRAPNRPAKNAEPKILQVKMLTGDPDVVIYWQIEN